ncbi:MAG TPA: hypothetical protein VNJ02_03850 [Vicinamibacterales bacterium]|nr:hypothetical protein [Vicinamibacterales bacterium]
MLTATTPASTDARRFAVVGLGLSLGFFALLRLAWTEAHVVLPLTEWQGALAGALFGSPALPVAVTLACSGADALALCLGAVCAYPTRWRARLGGAAGGTALVLGLNTLRIGSLGQAAASPTWFNALHLYLWPAALTLAIFGYVFGWMWWMDRVPAPATPSLAPPPPRAVSSVRPSSVFIGLTFAFVAVFALAAPLYLESTMVLTGATWIAATAAAVLRAATVPAFTEGNVLWASGGGFLVTQECITTPLIPVYLAAVFSYARSRRWMVVGVIATLPIFFALGVVRLLLVAVPTLIASPTFLVHAFYQLLLGVVVIATAAAWRHPGRAAIRYGALGIAVAVAFGMVVGPFYTRVVVAALGPVPDPQGAIAMLPAFQTALYLAVCAAAFAPMSRARFLGGLVLLGATQAAGLAVLPLLTASGIFLHVRDIRGWAVAAPLLMIAAVATRARPAR